MFVVKVNCDETHAEVDFFCKQTASMCPCFLQKLHRSFDLDLQSCDLCPIFPHERHCNVFEHFCVDFCAICCILLSIADIGLGQRRASMFAKVFNAALNSVRVLHLSN